MSEASRMSRRSLRLHTTTGHYGDDTPLDSALNHSLGYSAPFSTGGPSRRDAVKALKSRRSQPLLQTPRKSLQGHGLTSSLHSCAASDASLLSSMLDESCIQESTLVDSFWGLDEEAELKERTTLNQSLMLQPNGEHSAQTQTSMVNGYFCKDCTVPTDKKEPLTTCSTKYIASSSSSSTPALSRSGTGERALTAGPAFSALSPPATVYSRDKSRRQKPVAHSSNCGTMNVKEVATDDKGLNLHGPLWRAAAGVFWWLGTAWYQLTTLISLLNVFVLTRCLPKLLKLLLLLLPFLLLLGVWSWGPPSLLTLLPAFNMTEWTTANLLSFSPSPLPVEEAMDRHTHTASLFTAPPSEADKGASPPPLHPERLARLEQSLSRLWERVEGGGRRLEQQHEEVMALYQAVQEQLHTQADRGSMEPWVSGLMDQRLERLRTEMEEEDRVHRQLSQQQSEQQEDQGSRLAQLELLLQALALKTEEVQRRQAVDENTTPAPLLPSSLTPATVPAVVGVDRESHDALLEEVQRLEELLASVRQDLQGVMGCQGRCGQLDSLQNAVSSQVSAQVRQELRSLFHSTQTTSPGDPDSSEPGPGEADLPDALLLWLSERFVSGASLQASLASLELRILQDVSVLLREEQGRSQAPCSPSLSQTVQQTVQETVGAAGSTGVTPEYVQLIVRNALKLYSQDRTGLVDYALESGGGSILSTRCSETYETRTALMSLFGLPLWYFSQSPRVVIQPDVHPGNCWAFRGSSGYLLIRLSMKIRPSAFSLEHIPKALSPTGLISSAPRQFTVYGLDDESQEGGTLLGSYTYEEDGDALQTYPVDEENDKAFQIIEVRVLSNWGHQEYTCLYRVRVHGEPV